MNVICLSYFYINYHCKMFYSNNFSRSFVSQYCYHNLSISPKSNICNQSSCTTPLQEQALSIDWKHYTRVEVPVMMSVICFSYCYISYHPKTFYSNNYCSSNLILCFYHNLSIPPKSNICNHDSLYEQAQVMDYKHNTRVEVICSNKHTSLQW